MHSAAEGGTFGDSALGRAVRGKGGGAVAATGTACLSSCETGCSRDDDAGIYGDVVENSQEEGQDAAGNEDAEMRESTQVAAFPL